MSGCVTILGLDPGLAHTGWGIVTVENNTHRHVANGTISTNAKAPLAERLKAIADGLTDVLAAHDVAEVALEETFVNKNPASSLKLAHARGVSMLACAQAGLRVTEYAPTAVKKAIVGAGRAEKRQVMQMLGVLLPSVALDSEDSADALAIAICHAHHRQFSVMVG